MWLFVLTVLSNICFGFFLDVSSGNAELMDEDLVKRIDAQVKVLTSNFHNLLIKVQNDRSEIGKQNKGLNQRLNTTVDNIKKLIINEEYLNQNIQALQTLTSEQQRELKKEKSISKKLTSNYNDLLFRVNREIDFLKNQNHYLEQKLNSTVEEMEKLMSEEETSSQNIVALQNITSQQQRDLDKEKSKSKKSRISVGSSWILLNNSLQELTNSTNIGFTNLNGNVLTENKLLREEMRKFEKRIKRRINKKLDNTVDGQWSSWIDTPSSVTCGVGCRLRYRECSNPYPQQGGKKCTGRRNKHVKCLQYDPCPVHGAWSVWSDNTCSVTCGVGTRSRSRSCSNPHPQYGGNNCTGNKINHVKCTHPNKCSGCQPDEWQCLSRRQCIPKEARCNDNFDCDDLSDELNCILPVQTCSYGLFRCGDGQCISPSYKCNKNKDCRDGSDESVALCAVSVEVDLLAAIGLPDPSKGVTNVVGLEGFPAFKLDKSSYIRKEAETYFTDRIKINDFAIVITVKVFSENGILFAVKGIYETVIAFGVRITAICNGKHNVVLYYNEEHTYGQISATIGNFTVDNIDKDSFTKLAIKVQGDIVTLFDNCEEVGRQQVLNRQPLQFRTGSPLYIGQGGPNVEDTSFEGVIQELKYYTNPAKAEELDCSSLDSGSGLGEVDLLAAIELPLRSKCVTNDVGLEGLPDLKLDKSSYIRKATKTYFTDKINDFAIVITVKVFSKDGILFAVKNVYESIIAFGVRITAIGNGEHNVVLYYKEEHTYGRISETIGNFTVDNLDKYSFTKLAIKVQGDIITLFDNCEEVGRQQVLNRQPLQFRAGSSLYIGEGGPNFEDTSFEGVIRELKYYTNPAKAEELDCSGYRGLRGRKGDRGRPGLNGLRGYKGDSGSVGPAGPPGLGFGGSGEILKGAKGALGERGLPGIPGTPGIGAQGQRGYQGEPGRNGLPGFQGPPGPAGKAGTVEVIRGPPGPPGPPGPSGVCTNDGGGGL